MREMAAQSLGAVLKHMRDESVRRVLALLLRLESQADWNVRHGGLLVRVLVQELGEQRREGAWVGY